MPVPCSYRRGLPAPCRGRWVGFSRQIDGSGVLTGAVTWIFSDELTLAASAYWPYGEGPSGAVLRSEYGGGAKSGLLQISFYY